MAVVSGRGGIGVAWLRRVGGFGIACGLTAAILAMTSAVQAEDNFAAFLAGLRPDAEAHGVSRATFDRETRGLQPDLSLPDLVRPGRPQPGSKGQAEFTVAPQAYVSARRIAQLASEGRALAKHHTKALSRIEKEIGVDWPIVLAIWGRETAFGKYKAGHDAIRVLATQAYTGRRKDLFRGELLDALKLIEDGRLKRSEMRASWAGAMGLTQFMPSEFYSSAVDLDGDGRIDLFGSVDDALGSAAKQLKNKGWIGGLPWGLEVATGQRVDCANEGPDNARPISEWSRLGVRRADGKPFAARNLAAPAYLMSPGGTYGPQFLVTENFKVLRAYNTSDLYALFVGHLSDQIAGGATFRTPWAEIRQLAPAGILEVQERLHRQGFSIAKLDGRIGSETRLKIGLYQRANSLAVDCWPSSGLLTAMRAKAKP
ncbi:MAG: lytic murein transglycosylase [Hyphomicrobiaceae bacterium]